MGFLFLHLEQSLPQQSSPQGNRKILWLPFCFKHACSNSYSIKQYSGSFYLPCICYPRFPLLNLYMLSTNQFSILSKLFWIIILNSEVGSPPRSLMKILWSKETRSLIYNQRTIQENIFLICTQHLQNIYSPLSQQCKF